ncbi:uncharacterized protein LOC114765584 [Denticeps clupeoides]|uniref:uncharacterized protein LOC114765584 n=1 Tax=Denticeps clupeoides TaxID=299321 RepID=UPI0010A57288|nr:uncharacterized protein LOC114765584 [Denticeps clupeoides]
MGSLLRSFISLSVLAGAAGHLVVNGGAGGVSASVGDEVTLSCTVDTHEEIKEVVWKRPDQDVIVLLYKGGEVLPESSHERYRGRAEFFPAEIHKGNFSLRLKEVRTEDKGDFMCEVHTSLLSASTTVLLQDLGLSWLHVLILLLCVAALLLALSLSAFFCLTMRGRTPENPKILTLHCLLVFGPNVLLFAAFVLWGLTEGFPAEVVSCSALVLSRFLLLFSVALYVEQLPVFLQKIVRNCFSFECSVIATVVCADIFCDIWNTNRENVAALVFIGIMAGYLLNMEVKTFFAGGVYNIEFMYLFGVFFGSRGFTETMLITIFTVGMGGPILGTALIIISKKCGVRFPDWFLMLVKALFMLARIIPFSIILYYCIHQSQENTDDAGLLSVVVLLVLVSLCDQLKYAYGPSYPARASWTMYVCGAVGLCAVNSVTLLVELIMKTRSGRRSVKDLRWLLFPAECLFVCGWLSLFLYYYGIKRVMEAREMKESAAGDQTSLQDLPESPQVNQGGGTGRQMNPPMSAAEESQQLLSPDQVEEKKPAELRVRGTSREEQREFSNGHVLDVHLGD